MERDERGKKLKESYVRGIELKFTFRPSKIETKENQLDLYRDNWLYLIFVLIELLTMLLTDLSSAAEA